MSVTRTPIYLTEEQRRRIDDLAAVRGVTLTEIACRALDAYLDIEVPDPAPVLTATFGAAPDISVPSRDEWRGG